MSKLNVPEAEKRARKRFHEVEPYVPTDPMPGDFLALADLARRAAPLLVAHWKNCGVHALECGLCNTVRAWRAAGLLPKEESR